MSKQLYEEALADVKRLKEVAEDNAKKALLDAVTPRIKDLIENQLLGEADLDDKNLLFDEIPKKPHDHDDHGDVVPPLVSQPDESGKVMLDLDALKPAALDDEYELSMESLDALKVMTSDRKSTRLNSSHVSESRMPSSA